MFGLHRKDQIKVLIIFVTAVTPTRKYCYRRKACDSGVILNDNQGGYAADKKALLVDKEECCSNLSGYSWGLYGASCEPCPSTAQESQDDIPDTLQGLFHSQYAQYI
jgi:TB domain